MSNEKVPVSVIILTFNEEQNIEQCLRSVADWAGEIFIVDSGSTDRTLEIAQRYSVQIISHPFENYSKQRNWAQKNLSISFEWVFHIDADERASPELVQSARKFFETRSADCVDGVLVTRRTVFMGRPILHGGHYPTYHLRLFHREKGRCEERLYDQHFMVDGRTVKVAGDLIDVITSDLTVWLIRHARWGAAEALEQLNGQAPVENRVVGNLAGTPIERRRWLQNSLYGRAPLFLRAFAYFGYRYLFRLGFLDGVEGLIFHFLQGCCYRFYVDAKIYEAHRRPQSVSKP